MRTELRDGDGSVLLTSPDPAAGGDAPRFPTLDHVDGAALVALVPASGPRADVVGYGRFHQDGDVILYPTVVRLAGSPDVYYVAWRRLAGSTQTRAQISSLLGNDALRRLGGLAAVDADGTLRGIITAQQVGRALREALQGTDPASGPPPAV